MHKIVYDYDAAGKQTGYSVLDRNGKVMGRNCAAQTAHLLSKARRKRLAITEGWRNPNAGVAFARPVVSTPACGLPQRRKEDYKNLVIDYIQKGGLLMWPILICSIISIGVFAERLFYLHRATIHVGEFLKGLSNLDSAPEFRGSSA